MTRNNNPIGRQTEASTATEYNQLEFVVQQIIRRNASATLVQVKSVTNNDDASPVGSVDVQPMVHQVDGAGRTVPHGVVHNLPYFRVQGGTNAVIMDPKVGDIGIALFASHDISKVKTNKAPAPPGSGRRFSLSDGMYVGGLLNGTPTQYVRFHAGGIEVKTDILTVMGDVQVAGTLTATTDVIGGGKSLKTHRHSGVQTGGGQTGTPV